MGGNTATAADELGNEGGEGLEDLQGSVRKAVKTQAELLAEKSELSVGEGTIHDTFEDIETEDENHDGIPDDEESLSEESDWEYENDLADLVSDNSPYADIDNPNSQFYQYYQNASPAEQQAYIQSKQASATAEQNFQTSAATSSTSQPSADAAITADKAKLQERAQAAAIVEKHGGTAAEREQAARTRKEAERGANDLTTLQQNTQGMSNEQKWAKYREAHPELARKREEQGAEIRSRYALQSDNRVDQQPNRPRETRSAASQYDPTDSGAGVGKPGLTSMNAFNTAASPTDTTPAPAPAAPAPTTAAPVYQQQPAP